MVRITALFLIAFWIFSNNCISLSIKAIQVHEIQREDSILINRIEDYLVSNPIRLDHQKDYNTENSIKVRDQAAKNHNFSNLINGNIRQSSYNLFTQLIKSFISNFLNELGGKSFICIILIYTKFPTLLIFSLVVFSGIMLSSLHYLASIGIMSHEIGILVLCSMPLAAVSYFILAWQFSNEFISQFQKEETLLKLNSNMEESYIDLHDDYVLEDNALLEETDDSAISNEKNYNLHNNNNNNLDTNHDMLKDYLLLIGIMIFGQIVDKAVNVQYFKEYQQRNQFAVFMGFISATTLAAVASMLIGFLLQKNLNQSNVKLAGFIILIAYGLSTLVHISTEIFCSKPLIN